MSETNQSYLKKLKSIEVADATSWMPGEELIMERALGSYVWDVEGKCYFDWSAGFGALALGHNPPIVRNLFSAFQDDEAPPIMHGLGDVYASRSKIDLITALKSLLPSQYQRMALAVTGSQACEYALKSAFLKTRRFGVIAFRDGYHGLDLGILPCSYREDFRLPFHGFIAGKQTGFCTFAGSVELLNKEFSTAVEALKRNGDDLAAVLVEPVQGRGGVRTAPLEWLRALHELAKKAGALLIFDEVLCGLGRTGRVSYSELVEADLLCFGKILGGGLPLSACVGTEAAMSGWPDNHGEAIHTGTFFGHPLSCALAAATLKEMKQQNLFVSAKENGAQLLQYFKEQLLPLSHIVDVRGEGLLIAIESKRENGGVKMAQALQRHFILTIPCGPEGRAISLTPALNLSKEALLGAAKDLVDVIKCI